MLLDEIFTSRYLFVSKWARARANTFSFSPISSPMKFVVTTSIVVATVVAVKSIVLVGLVKLFATRFTPIWGILLIKSIAGISYLLKLTVAVAKHVRVICQRDQRTSDYVPSTNLHPNNFKYMKMLCNHDILKAINVFFFFLFCLFEDIILHSLNISTILMPRVMPKVDINRILYTPHTKHTKLLHFSLFFYWAKKIV